MVRITNRAGNTAPRTTNAQIKVGGQNCGTISSSAITAGIANNNVIDVECASTLEGTTITITTFDILNLMEVEVYGSIVKPGMIS